MIYRVVIIGSPEQMVLFDRTLKANKSLATQHIASLSIDYFYKEIPSHPDRASMEKKRRKAGSVATWDVLKTVKGLYHLGIDNYSLEPTPGGTKGSRIPRQVLRGLKSLSIRERPPCKAGYADWLAVAAPTLERLRCPMYAPIIVPDSLPHLRSLNFSPTWGRSPKFLNVAIGREGSVHRPALEDLSMNLRSDDKAPDVLAALKQQSPTLRRLHLSLLYCMPRGSDAAALTRSVLSIVRAATRLRVLALQIDELSTPSGVTAKDLADALPAGLREFTFGGRRSRETDIATELVELVVERSTGLDPQLPELCNLTIGAVDGHYSVAHRGVQVKLRQGPRKKLIEAARKEGLEIVLLQNPMEPALPWRFVNSGISK